VKPYYDDGQCVIYHGDCREILPSIEADVLVTDPPYGVAHASNRLGRFQGQGIAGDADTGLRDAVLAEWAGPAIVFGSWKRPRPAGTRMVLIWDKGDAAGMGDLSLPWKPNAEEIYVLGAGWRGSRNTSVLRDTSVLTWSGNGQRQHPNQKPIPLLRALIEKAPDHPIVLDPFMGSGTTLRAAKDLGRKAIGIEVEESYCEIAAQRLGQEVLDLGAAA
jgi:DNA modification methylase